jgi:hypothetical protein
MALSLFRSKDVAVPARPALTALRAHLAISTSIAKQIEHLNTRLTSVHRDVRIADDLGARVLAARANIDTQMANARYSDARPPDLTDAKRQLSILEQEFVPAAESARIARLVMPQLQADVAALAKKRASMQPTTDRLLWDACVETAVLLQPAYQSAVDNMRNTAHSVFAALTAADTVSQSRGFGKFFGGELYSELFIPRPSHPAYCDPSLTPEAAQQIRIADAEAIHSEAEALITSLLNGADAA